MFVAFFNFICQIFNEIFHSHRRKMMSFGDEIFCFFREKITLTASKIVNKN